VNLNKKKALGLIQKIVTARKEKGTVREVNLSCPPIGVPSSQRKHNKLLRENHGKLRK